MCSIRIALLREGVGQGLRVNHVGVDHYIHHLPGEAGVQWDLVVVMGTGVEGD